MKYLTVLILSLGISGYTAPVHHTNRLLSGSMMKIPAGFYKPFYLKKGKPSKVAVKSFYLDVHAVTNEDFLQFVKANPGWAKSKVSRLLADDNYLCYWAGDFNIGPDYNKIKNSPVTNVSWFAANAYAHWKGKRLPTCNEWEYAAGATVAGLKSDKKDTLTSIILRWYEKPNTRLIPNVETTFKNRLGIFDMHGLIWEWVFDFNVPVNDGDVANKNLFCSAGSLNSANRKDYASYMRFALRNSLKGNYCLNKLGFRCAKDLAEKLN
jgi:formylglycine-generating enzyme